MGRWHAHGAARAGGRVVALVDRDVHRAEELAARFPGAQVSRDLHDVLDLVDVVQICTPSVTHASLTAVALDARRHVLVEKPLAPTAPAVAALLELAERREVLLCPVHQFPFQEGVRRAIAGLPQIQPLRHVSFTTCSAGGGGDDSKAEQVALEILPHPLSLVVRLGVAVEKIDWVVRHPAAGELRALGSVGELTVSLLISMSGRPTSNVLELIGRQGTTSVDLFHGFAVRHSGDVSRIRKAGRPFTAAAATMRTAAGNLARRAWRLEPAYPGLRTLIEAFYLAVQRQAPPPISPAEIVAVAEETDRLRHLLGLTNEAVEA